MKRSQPFAWILPLLLALLAIGSGDAASTFLPLAASLLGLTILSLTGLSSFGCAASPAPAPAKIR